MLHSKRRCEREAWARDSETHQRFANSDRSCCFSYGFFTLFWCFFFEMHFETVRPQGVLCGEEAPGTTKMKLSAP